MTIRDTIKKSTGYGLTNPLQDLATLPILARRAPATTDTKYAVGQLWIDTVGGTTYTMMPTVGGAAVWTAAYVGVNLAVAGTITSGGALTVSAGGAAITGASTINGGTVGLGTDNAANAISIGLGNVARAIHIGDSAAAHVITIGSIVGACSITERVGTGNYSLDGAATSNYTFAPSTTSGTINFGGTGANTGTMTIAGGTGAQEIDIANSTGGKTINIGTGAGNNTTILGTTNGTSSTTIRAGSGGITLTGAIGVTGAVTTTGNVIVNGAGTQLRVHGGAATDFIGETTLVGGVATVLNTNIAAADRILLSRRSINASTAVGHFTYVINPGVSFVITSVQTAAPAVTEANDVSIIEYVIVRQV